MFSSAILLLLHQEANKYTTNTYYDSETESSGPEDEDEEDEVEEEDSASEKSEDLSSGNPSTGVLGPQSPIDNSSKPNNLDQLIDTESDEDNTTEDSDEEDSYFFHIAFTPKECTVMCSSKVMYTLFKEPLKHSRATDPLSTVKLLDEEFVTLQVDSSDGYDNSSKVLLLTKPLSTNNIPLFFLSTHFGDIVLIPETSREKVIKILSQKNFEFSNLSNSYINVKLDELTPIGVGSSGSNSPNLDIEQKAFVLFNDANVTPIINKSTKLLLTGSRLGEVSKTLLKTATNLASIDIQSESFPEYFAVTRTSLNEVSLLLPKSSKKRAKLGFPSKCIIGSTQDAIIPITIDLNALPLDSTGIVAGLASRLLRGSKTRSQFPLEMSYLSMARSGIVMVPQEDIELITSILEDDIIEPIDNLRLE